jgi:hypothetical protein
MTIQPKVLHPLIRPHDLLVIYSNDKACQLNFVIKS